MNKIHQNVKKKIKVVQNCLKFGKLFFSDLNFFHLGGVQNIQKSVSLFQAILSNFYFLIFISAFNLKINKFVVNCKSIRNL